MSENTGEVYVDDKGNILEGVTTTPEDSVEDTPEVHEDPVEQLSDDSDDDDDQPEDDHGNTEGTEEEREAIRERRRQERQSKKARQRERESRLKAELAARDAAINQMREELDAIHRRNTSGEMAQLQNARTQAAQAYSHYKTQVELATAAQDGRALTDAIEKMQLAQRRIEELGRIEQAYQRQQRAPAPLDPRLKTHAEKWMSQNKWYNPAGDDEDSEIALTIDRRMAREGWDPTTSEYWTELSRRIREKLPHRSANSPQSQPKRRNVVGSSDRGSSARGGNSGTFSISPERVQAMKDMGVWNDPVKRAEMIQEYKKYDQQKKNSQ